MGGIGCGPGAAPAIARARVRAASSCARQLNRRDRLRSRRRTCTWRRPVPQVLPPMYSHRGKRRSAGATSRASRGFSPLGQPSGRFFAIPVRANSYRPHISTCSLLRSPGRLGWASESAGPSPFLAASRRGQRSATTFAATTLGRTLEMAEMFNAVLDRIEARQRTDAIDGTNALEFLQAIYRRAFRQDARGDRGPSI